MMEWRSDGLVPTYTDGEMFAWVIDGRISLETDNGLPIAAWAEFTDHRSATGRPLLATFRVHGPGYEIWRLSEPDAEGLRSASELPRELITRYIPYSSMPHRTDRQDASPLLCRLWDDAQAQLQARIEAGRRAREADPLISIVDALGEAGTGYASADEDDNEPDKARAAEYIRELIAGIDQQDLPEVLFRITVENGTASLLIADADD